MGKVKSIDIIDINAFLKRELNSINSFFKNDLHSNGYSIGNLEHNNINKLYILKVATEYGILVPETHLILNKNDICVLLENGEYITKPASDAGFIMLSKSAVLGGYTHLISKEEVNNISQNFFPTLVQEKIEKEYELRIFYLKPNFYASAILSQNDERTKIDFRNYNKSKPNRTLPYILPNGLKKKLAILLNRFNFNACSIDMIVNKNGQYYFLEINPVGQFEFSGYHCNYYLDYVLAKGLITHENN